MAEVVDLAKKRRVLVTGAASGIGAVVAHAFAGIGDHVVATDIAPFGPRQDWSGITTLIGDVRDRNFADEAVREATATDGRLDVLVNCAAIFAGLAPQPFEAIELDAWRRLFDVNVLGVVANCQAASGPLRAAKGRIVNIASTSVMEGAAGFAHYVASKGAIIALTRALAREMGPDGVTVNAVAPGLTLSEHLVTSGFAGSPAAETVRARRCIDSDQVPNDVVGAVLFLASAGAAMISGQTLIVDGGAVFL